MTEIFNLLVVFLINTLLFVRITKRVKKKFGSSHSNVFLKVGVPGENKKVGKVLGKKI